MSRNNPFDEIWEYVFVDFYIILSVFNSLHETLQFCYFCTCRGNSNTGKASEVELSDCVRLQSYLAPRYKGVRSLYVWDEGCLLVCVNAKWLHVASSPGRDGNTQGLDASCGQPTALLILRVLQLIHFKTISSLSGLCLF